MRNTKEKMAFLNTKLPVEERIADLLKRLTLEEKIGLLHELSPPIPRLNIEKYYHGNEALHGIVRPGRATVFPQAIAIASTWNPKLVYALATAISDEARAKYYNEDYIGTHNGLLTFWSPTVNMARDPRWGRTAETYGEDPFLTSQIGIEFVKGLQGNDPTYLKVVSTPKHFVANNEEHNRFRCKTNMSEKVLREYYLPAFKALITEGKAFSIMGAYNALGNVPCSQNKRLITDILRNEWGFEGYAVTDCGAIYHALPQNHDYVKTLPEAAAATINAGIDLECGDVYEKGYLLQAVKDELVSMETIDFAVKNVLKGRFKLGLFDPKEQNPYFKISYSVVGSKAHSDLALQVSHESIVLLKNSEIQGKKLLPLDLDGIKTIAVIGPNARACQFGDYSGTPVNEAISPIMGLKRKLGKNVIINDVGWIRQEEGFQVIPKAFLRPERDKDEKYGMKRKFYSQENFEGEPDVQIDDVIDFHWQDQNVDPSVNQALKILKSNLNTLRVSGRYTSTTFPDLKDIIFSFKYTGYLLPEITGTYTLKLQKKGCEAMLLINGEQTEKNSATVQLEAGKAVEIHVEVPKMKMWMKPSVSLQWNLTNLPLLDGNFSREIEAVNESDLVIAFLGLGLSYEREGTDKEHLQLPSEQEDLIQAVYKANPKIIVVLINGSPLAVNWIDDNIPAILEAWYPGERGGDAIADILIGDYNPGGRLPITFYKGIHQLLPFNEYNIDKGQTYMYLKDEPLYPFGHGLSYTKFKYHNLKVEPNIINIQSVDIITFLLTIENIGKMDGDEVVQLYVKDLDANGPENKKPFKIMKSFKRIYVKSGNIEQVKLPLRVKDLAIYDINQKKWIIEPRKLEVLIGASSEDIRLTIHIELV